MHNFDVKIFGVKSAELITPIPDQVYYLRSAKFATLWLARLCCWVLKKLGCAEQASEITVDYLSFNIGEPGHKKIMDVLHHRMNIDGVLEHQPSYIYVGHKEYKDLLSDRESVAHFKMEHDVEIRGYRGELFNMKLVVVPWMEGMLIV